MSSISPVEPHRIRAASFNGDYIRNVREVNYVLVRICRSGYLMAEGLLELVALLLPKLFFFLFQTHISTCDFAILWSNEITKEKSVLAKIAYGTGPY